MSTFQFAIPLAPNDSPTQPPTTVVTVVRKRGRCDSDPQGRPEKMYKGYEVTNIDTEMEGLVSALSPASPTSSGLLLSEIDPNSQRSWRRDEEFYMEDGSCVFLVGDILFNVS